MDDRPNISYLDFVELYSNTYQKLSNLPLIEKNEYSKQEQEALEMVNPPMRLNKAEGGFVKGKDDVPYTKEDPSDRVDPFTGSPYSDQMARLGLAEGGMAEDELLNFILATEDINLYRDYKQGNLDKEVIAHEGSKRFQEQHGKKDVSTIGGITDSGITKATVGETVGMVKERINKERQYLNQIIPEEKIINIPQSVQDSAVSLIFNVGQSAFKNSKAYQNLLDGDIQGYYREAFDPQQGFTKITGADGTKQIDEGLVNRRRQ
jgi:GH24 family phage-related lysozyme (muramidase)